MEVKLVQYEKQPLPKVLIFKGMVMEVKPVQLEKQLPPIDVTEDGIVMEVKPVQPEKEFPSNVVTEEGIVMEVKPVQPEKLQSPKATTVYNSPSLPLIFSGITMSPEYPFDLGKRVAVFVFVSSL